MRLSKLNSDVRYKKSHLNAQMNTVFNLCSLDATTTPIEADICTYQILADIGHPRHTNDIKATIERHSDLDAYLVATADIFPPLAPTTSEEIRIAQVVDEFCVTMRVCFGKGHRVHFALNNDNVLFRLCVGFKKRVILQALVKHLINMIQDTVMAGHPSGRRLY